MVIEKKKLEVGCGNFGEKEEDTIYLDIMPFKKVDIVRDVERGLPFYNETFEEIKAHHILEHIKELVFVMNEFYRVLRKDGILDIEVPYGVNARIDPNHIRFFEQNGFDFFLFRDVNSVVAGVQGWFDLIKLEKIGPSETDIRELRFILKKDE